MSRSTASKESILADTVKVSVTYHGKRYTSTRSATLAYLMITPNGMVKLAAEGAKFLMEQALSKAKRRR